jgi:outer membrane protein TolC
MKKIILLLSFSLTFAHAEAVDQSPLALQNAIESAEANNPEIQRLEAASEKTSWTKLEALSGHLPHVSMGYDHYFNSTYERENVFLNGSEVPFPAAYPQDNGVIDVSLTLFDGLGSIYSYRAADLNTQASQLELSRAKFELEQNVTTAFYQALAAQKLLEVAKQNILTLQSHLERAKLTEKAGYGTRFDILRIQATLEEAQSEQEAAENNIIITRNALAEAMGEEHPMDAPLKGELPVLKESMIPGDIELSLEDRQDYRAQTLRDEAASKISSASKAFWYPSVSLFAQEQLYKFGGFDPSIGENSGFQNANAFGVRLKWNLFDGGYSYAKQREASAAALEAQAQTRKSLVKLPKDFENWKRKFFYNVSLYKARLRAQEQFQESVRLAEVGVKAGSRTHTEMLDAELDLFRARGGVVRAQADAIESLQKLQLAVGRRLVQLNP